MAGEGSGARVRLDRLVTHVARIPFPSLAADSRYRTCEILHVEVSGDGASGAGFAYALSGGAPAIASLVEGVLWPLIKGEDGTAVRAHWRRMVGFRAGCP